MIVYIKNAKGGFKYPYTRLKTEKAAVEAAFHVAQPGIEPESKV